MHWHSIGASGTRHADNDKDINPNCSYGCVLYLNDDYSGGEFLMFDNEEEIKLKKGEIIVFPSIFLYPHRVAPVTKGIRDSFVSWVY